MHLTLAFISALLATAKAIQVTQPAAGGTVDVSQDWKVSWTSVSTDPAQICLYLSNFVDYPPQTIFLKGPLDTTLGSTVVGGQCYAGLPIR
ncbi:hypothetical protein BBP40_008703 [Aspergillus hancockii]|nr:hypothetical protein BBP40_008703 [Aspergillus hancockii]